MATFCVTAQAHPEKEPPERPDFAGRQLRCYFLQVCRIDEVHDLEVGAWVGHGGGSLSESMAASSILHRKRVRAPAVLQFFPRCLGSRPPVDEIPVVACGPFCWDDSTRSTEVHKIRLDVNKVTIPLRVSPPPITLLGLYRTAIGDAGGVVSARSHMVRTDRRD